MRVLFTARAKRHLDEISKYITERNPKAATRVGRRIHDVTSLLGYLPHLGRPGVVNSTREMVVPGLPYVIVYRVIEERDQVVILGVYHGAQLRP